MKRIKLFSTLLIFLISFFVSSVSSNLNAQGSSCKINFCNCCGDSAYYVIYELGVALPHGSFWTWGDGCTHVSPGINFTAGVTYVIEDCEGNPTYFTACPCGDTDTLKIPCCDGNDVNNKNKNIPPKEFKLDQNFPNPFNPTTMISFELPEAVSVTLTIYDVTGKVIERPFVNNTLKSGYHEYVWNTDNNGLSSGIYFYKLEAGNFSETKKMILMK